MDIVYIICLTILTLFLLLLFVDIIIGFGIFYSFFTKKGKYKRRMEKLNFSAEEPISEMEKLSIFSFDGIKLSAFYENDNNSKIVLLVHGYGQSKKNLIPYSKIFRSLGFDQLLLDLRCHGESEGDEISLGEKEAKDIDLWIDKVLEIKKDYQIVLFGLGIGANAILNCSKNNSIKCFIIDSCFDNAQKEFLYLKSKNKIKLKLINKIFFNYLKRNKNINLKNIDNCEKLKIINKPVLIFHGENDDIIPVEMAYNLYSSLPDDKREINIFKNCKHLEELNNDRFLYKNCIRKFTSRYLN